MVNQIQTLTLHPLLAFEAKLTKLLFVYSRLEVKKLKKLLR